MNQGDREQVFEKAAELFGLLSSPVRVRIVRELLVGERNVSELMDLIGTSQPNLSQHLSTLYRSGLLARRRDGSHVIYRLANARLGVLAEWVKAQALVPSRAAAASQDSGEPIGQ